MNEIKVVVKGVLVKNNKILIVQRSKIETVVAGTWETVGGNLHFGKSFETALKREFSEEVGLNITVKNQLFSTIFHTSKKRQICLLTLLPKKIIADFRLHDVFDLLN